MRVLMKIQEIASEAPPSSPELPIRSRRMLVDGQKDRTGPDRERSLFQEWFFFCRVKKIGDAPGAGCIYVETVVDSDSGVAFAKVYPRQSAMNAVDILSSRVVPFFHRLRVAIKEIHTRRTDEYCGLPPKHPYETFLAASHIQHLGMDEAGQPTNYLCLQFYRYLLKDFFPLALRKHFQLSLTEMQKELDDFVDSYNSI
jgi:hypothetical protein